MKAVLWASACVMILGSATGISAQKRGAKKVFAPSYRPAQAKQQNQFVTVDEFIKARIPAGVGVSVEGYAALGYRASDGGIRLYIVDSVDHILSPADADASARTAAVAVITPAVLRSNPAWGWTARGSKKVPMYSGNGSAQTKLRDVAPRIRVTGWSSAGRATISPATKLEITNEDGSFVVLK